MRGDRAERQAFPQIGALAKSICRNGFFDHAEKCFQIFGDQRAIVRELVRVRRIKGNIRVDHGEAILAELDKLPQRVVNPQSARQPKIEQREIRENNPLRNRLRQERSLPAFFVRDVFAQLLKHSLRIVGIGVATRCAARRSREGFNLLARSRQIVHAEPITGRKAQGFGPTEQECAARAQARKIFRRSQHHSPMMALRDAPEFGPNSGRIIKVIRAIIRRSRRRATFPASIGRCRRADCRSRLAFENLTDDRFVIRRNLDLHPDSDGAFERLTCSLPPDTASANRRRQNRMTIPRRNAANAGALQPIL